MYIFYRAHIFKWFIPTFTKTSLAWTRTHIISTFFQHTGWRIIGGRRIDRVEERIEGNAIGIYGRLKEHGFCSNTWVIKNAYLIQRLSIFISPRWIEEGDIEEA
jgi:hypothetical protein